MKGMARAKSDDQVSYTCYICSKLMSDDNEALKCDICNSWLHIKCIGVNKKTYELLKDRVSNYIGIVRLVIKAQGSC